MDCLYSIENFENDFTILSAIPLLGTIPALCRGLFGLIQLVVATALFIFSLSDAVQDAFPDLGLYAIEHIVHGAANFFWGTAMAIPVLGTILFIIKKKGAKAKEEEEATPYIGWKYGMISPGSPKKKRPSEEQSPLTRLSFFV